MPVINKWDKTKFIKYIFYPQETYSEYQAPRTTPSDSPQTVSIPACHYSRAERLKVRKAKPHPNFADVRVFLPADALEIVTLSLHCAV